MEIEGTNSISSRFPAFASTLRKQIFRQDLPEAAGSEAVAFQVNTGQLFVLSCNLDPPPQTQQHWQMPV